MNREKNEVYIVGGDHHNGLGLGRMLGLNGVKVNSLVIDGCKKSYISKSKYISTSKIFSSEKEAYDFLSLLPRSKLKPIIIPYSDAAALELDKRLDEFKDRYFCPSINNTQGKIAKLMDKQAQYELALSAGIRMADTAVVELHHDFQCELIETPYPCIIKPVISTEGDKRDISVCYNRNELDKTLRRYREQGYSRALVQEYLKIDYEIDVFGCILKQKPYICQVPTRIIRSWPKRGGTTSFSQVITDQKVVAECERLIRILKEQGFYGLYDIELFVVDGKTFLNEINFRNSGGVYRVIRQGFYFPYIWYCDVLGIKCDICSTPQKANYSMTEYTDIRHVLSHDIKVRDWINDFRKCTDYALLFKGDMGPAVTRYLYYVKQFIAGKRM